MRYSQNMRLTDILSPQAVIIPLTGTTKQQVIAEMIDRLAAIGSVSDRDLAIRAVMEREQTRTTGIGAGLAVPHGKCGAVTQLVMAVGKPAEPLDFQSIDGKPVSVVFLMLSPIDKTGPHIQALARISRLFSLDTVRKQLLAAATTDDVYRVLTAQDQPV